MFTPDPAANVKQVFVGFNGPEQSGVTVIRSKSDAAASWLALAISPTDLKLLLAQVHLESQSLLAFAVGERESATGQVFVTDVSYNAVIDSFTVTGGVGANEMDCSFEVKTSYPFAVVIASRPPRIPGGSALTLVTLGMAASNQ